MCASRSSMSGSESGVPHTPAHQLYPVQPYAARGATYSLQAAHGRESPDPRFVSPSRRPRATRWTTWGGTFRLCSSHSGLCDRGLHIGLRVAARGGLERDWNVRQLLGTRRRLLGHLDVHEDGVLVRAILDRGEGSGEVVLEARRSIDVDGLCIIERDGRERAGSRAPVLSTTLYM